LSALEKDVLSVLSVEGSFVDEIAMACRIPVSEALSSLTLLELKGMVRQFSGKRFAPR
jgi:DNA-binding IclR family transcriptional regulator